MYTAQFIVLIMFCMCRWNVALIVNSYFPDFSGETPDLKRYYLVEAWKYNCLSKCSNHGYCVLTKRCIVKPPTSSSF